MSDWSDEETDDPTHADRRNFYKVEKWSRDGTRVIDMLFAGSNRLLVTSQTPDQTSLRREDACKMRMRAPSSLQNIRLGSAAANPWSRSRNRRADGDGCVGSVDAAAGSRV